MKLLAFLEQMRIKYQTELDEYNKPEPFNRRSFVRGILFAIKYIVISITRGRTDE